MKKLIIIIIIIVLVGVPAYLVLSTRMSQDNFYTQLNEFSSLLNQQEYEQARNIYDSASDSLKANYNISLEGHAQDLAEKAKKEATTQDSLDMLYAFREIGYGSETIDDAIEYYENLLQSNYIFQQGLEHYSNKEYEEAMACFSDVLEYDDNYQAAQGYLEKYQTYIMAWKEAADNNKYGRSTYPNAIAYQDNFIYLPYKFDDANAILKINSVTYSIISIPIVSNENGAEISDLNIVGDYIFFLIKQDTLIPGEKSNNAVYRISTSGENLEKLTDCDYTYLISYKDRFYAVSKSQGLISTDNYFQEEIVLSECEDEVVNIQLTDEGIYYTSHNDETGINTQYYYDGETTEEIDDGKNLHYYNYGTENIIYYDSNAFYEYMFHQDLSSGAEKNTLLYPGDIYKYYGMLNGSILFTILGDYQQECMRVKNIRTYANTYKAATNEISYIPLGICYDAGMILLQSDAGISLTTENMRIQQTIALPHLNNSVLTENEQLITVQNDYFSQEPVLVTNDNQWYYSDENVSIRTEKLYFETIESTVYISYIHTADNKWLEIEQMAKQESLPDKREHIIWAAAAQAYGKEPEVIDDIKGILNTDVYTFNDDGMFFVYRSADLITADKILASNIRYVFSQGTIILDDYKITNDSIAAGGSLSGRSAIGMIEAGNYVVVTAEESTRSNKGLSLYTLAQIFKEEGCVSAYSFDYNAGPFLIFDNEYIYQNIIKSENTENYNEAMLYTAE